MQSLRKRPTYNEVVNYLENDQPKIKYPNRTASFLRNSPYLSQFDGDSSFIELEEQQNKITQQRIIETIKRLAAQNNTTAAVERYNMATSGYNTPRSNATSVHSDIDPDMMQLLEDADKEEEEEKKNKLVWSS